MWKIKKIVKKGDYEYAVVKEHPNASLFGYVLHHRVVMENHLGRILNSKEVVHHKNENKKDNRIENLEVVLDRDHNTHHSGSIGRKYVELKCPECKMVFNRPHNVSHLTTSREQQFTACSKSCRGKFSRRLQLHGLTTEMESAVSENIVREYRKYSHGNPEGTHDNETP